MSTIMHRSAAKFWWGKDLPPGVKYMVSEGGYSGFVDGGPKWTPVTYKEVNARRAERMQDNIQNKLGYPSETKPAYIWVFHNTSWIMGGWYLYVKTAYQDYALNFRNPRSDMVNQIMNLHPCGVLPLSENFEAWCKAFSKKHAHKGFKRKKNQGLLKCRVVISAGDRIEQILAAADYKLKNTLSI